MLTDPARAAIPPAEVPPIGRRIHPEEVAALVAFLLSEDAAAITGQRSRSAAALAVASQLQFTCRITVFTLSKISPIWSSVMISGGESAMVSPVMRNISPCSWKARSIES